MTGALLALAAVLILGVHGGVVWAITRIRTHRASYRHGHDAGYRKAYAEQEILVDELREENDHLNEMVAELSREMVAELSRQQRRAAA